MASEKILVVDDEPTILEAVKYNLEKAGFRAITASDGETAVVRCRRDKPDLMILDLMLPKTDGLEVCRILKQDPATRHIPILILTVKAEETEKVVGLELGADDYLTKPFSPRELVARVKAVLRRGQAPPAETVQIGALQIDWGKHLVAVKGQAVTLTAKEFDLLKALIDAKGRVLSRDFLLDHVWEYERSFEIKTRTVDLHISQLRKKLRQEGPRILTVKNAGYRFVIDE